MVALGAFSEPVSQLPLLSLPVAGQRGGQSEERDEHQSPGPTAEAEGDGSYEDSGQRAASRESASAPGDEGDHSAEYQADDELWECGLLLR